MLSVEFQKTDTSLGSQKVLFQEVLEVLKFLSSTQVISALRKELCEVPSTSSGSLYPGTHTNEILFFHKGFPANTPPVLKRASKISCINTFK